MTSARSPEEIARRELGEFLRSRRQRLTPEDVGLPAAERRRTPGLRREEVCALANVSHSWYTWVEQGRSMKASPELLLCVCKALRLDEHEVAYVLELVARHADASTALTVEPAAELLDLLGGLTHTPAVLYDYCWDIVASNDAWRLTFGDFEHKPRDERNIVKLAFTDMPGVEVRRPEIVSRFRAEFARHPGDARIQALVANLRASSQEFDLLWTAREVGAPASGARMYNTHFGPFRMLATHLLCAGAPDLRVLLVTPVPGSDFALRLSRVLYARDCPPGSDGDQPPGPAASTS